MTVADIVILVLIALSIIGVVAFCIRETLQAEHLRGVLSQQGMNEPEVATANFIKVVQQAEKSLMIHDDGNAMADSVYNDADAISALVKRMKKCDSLEVRCWFNVQAARELDLVTTIRKDERLRTRFKVRCRKQKRFNLWRFRWFDPHYKIADDGKYGMVSRHAFDSGRRQFRIDDCGQASPRGRTIVLGPYMRRFDRGFKRAISPFLESVEWA